MVSLFIAFQVTDISITTQQSSSLCKRKVNYRYIHKVHREINKGYDIIVTMLPSLAELLHDARYTLHDITYKRVAETK